MMLTGFNVQDAIRCCSTNPSIVRPADKPSELANKVQVKPPHQYGQPTSQSHPHLLRPGHLVAEVKASECSERRHRVMESIQKYAVASDPQLVNHVVRSDDSVAGKSRVH